MSPQDITNPFPASFADDFWARIRRSDYQACWLWQGGHGPNGYGHVRIQKRTWRVHRVAWLLSRGPIPRSLQVHHTCDVRLCCNPQHLWLGTQAENVDDMCLKERHRPGGRAPLHRQPE